MNSFVYTSSKPLHLDAFVTIFAPVTLGLPEVPKEGREELLDEEDEDMKGMTEGLLWSKGFCWLGHLDKVAFY